MNSSFNKETSKGVYTFSKNDVFEALTMWCSKKGIDLNDKNILAFDSSGNPDFVIEFVFNGKENKDAAST